MKWLDDLLGITPLKEANAVLTQKVMEQNDYIYQVGKDKSQLVSEKYELQAQIARKEQEFQLEKQKRVDDASVFNGAIESLKTALAAAETEIPTNPPIFIDYTQKAYLPNIQIMRPDKSMDDITVVNPCDVYSRSDLLNRSLGVSAARKLPKYQKLMKVWGFVTQALTYVNDFQDNWQYHGITIMRKRGDCEDGTVLFVDAARAVGIPATDVFNCVGDTSFGYHSYPIAFLSADDLKGTPCEATGAGFYIFESTLDFLPASPKKLNGSQYWCAGGLANWQYQGRIKPSSASLFNGIDRTPQTGARIGMKKEKEKRIENGKSKRMEIKKYWKGVG